MPRETIIGAIDNDVVAFMIGRLMGHREGLGAFEQHVMVVTLRLKENAYGAEIWRELNARTQREFVGAAIYSTLDGLEGRGYVVAEWGEATSVRGGRAKKFYTITEPGMAALAESKRLHDVLWEGLELGYPSGRVRAPRLDLKEAERSATPRTTRVGQEKREK
jgi:PadR family transcriptional regulator PadR